MVSVTYGSVVHQGVFGRSGRGTECPVVMETPSKILGPRVVIALDVTSSPSRVRVTKREIKKRPICLLKPENPTVRLKKLFVV